MLTDAVLEEEAINAGDDVFITGVFTSHCGETKNIPIVRAGVIAAMPEEPVWTPDGYMDAYLVEAHSIGGLSGSPVFVQMAPYRVVDGAVRQSTKRTHYLIGLMKGHFVIESTEDAVMEHEEGGTGKINTGIGVVVPSRIIEETCEQPKLAGQRQEILSKLAAESGGVNDSTVSPKKSEPSTTADNPSHAEDFSRLLASVVTEKPPDDQT